MKKPEPMKSRGVRLSNVIWEKIRIETKLDKTNRIKPSDIIRHAIDFYFAHKNKFKDKK